MTIIRVLKIQAALIVLMGISALLAAPFFDNSIEPAVYKNERCSELESGILQWKCRNHSWILLIDQIVFLPGFISILALPLTGCIAYVGYRHKKDGHGKSSE